MGFVGFRGEGPVLPSSNSSFFFCKMGRSDFFFNDLFVFKRERVCEQGEGQREREGKIPEADSSLSLDPGAGLHLTTLRS